MPDSVGLYRLSLTYELTDDGNLVARELPASRVPARSEGALYRRLAALADADDAAIVHAASRYGPLGPIRALALGDRPTFLWAMGEQGRQAVRGIRLLRAWVANGGRTPIPGNLAPVAHWLAAMAEADPVISQRLLDSLLEEGSPLTPEERQRLADALNVQEHAVLSAVSRRAHQLTAQARKGEAYVRVTPRPGAARYLRVASRLLPLLYAKAEEFGTTAALIPPDSLGRFATEIRPYFEENLYPPESTTAWRDAATEMAAWVKVVAAVPTVEPAEIRQAQALLTLRLQQVDAWPFPTGELLGTFARALWSLWPRIAAQPIQRRCVWLNCPTLLPAGAHGNRTHCDEHQREAARLRSALARQRARAG